MTKARWNAPVFLVVPGTADWLVDIRHQSLSPTYPMFAQGVAQATAYAGQFAGRTFGHADERDIMTTNGEKERAELQRLAETARAKNDDEGERFYSRLVWRSAKAERDQPTNQGNGRR